MAYTLRLKTNQPLTTSYNELRQKRLLSITINEEKFTAKNRKKMMWKELVKTVAHYFWKEIQQSPVIQLSDIFPHDNSEERLHHTIAFYSSEEEVREILKERRASKKLNPTKITYEGATLYFASFAGWDAVMLAQGILNKFGKDNDSIALELTKKPKDIIDDINGDDPPLINEITGQNRILYGPPGTGKSYSINSYKSELIGGQSTSKKDYQFTGLTWKEAVYLAFFEKNNQSLTIKEIDQTEVIRAYAKTKSNKTTHGTISRTITENATESSTNTTSRKGTDLFEKSGPNWKLTTDGMIEAEEVINSQYKHDNQEDYFFEMIAFHQSFSYEDFIEGIRAETVDGQIQYEIKKGVFLRFCEKAVEDPDNNYLFVIDEINRGNISKIFGELILLIEPSKRLGAKDEQSVTLPYSGDVFGIPQNIFLLGTMNTADRSIAFMDTALRRRFDFVEVMPDSALLSDIVGEIDEVDVGEVLQSMNKRIEYLLDRDHLLGHAFFIENETLEDLQNTFEMKIIPLLQEYFYDDYQKIKAVLNDIHDVYITPKQENYHSLFDSRFNHLIMNGDSEQLKMKNSVDLEDFKAFWRSIIKG
ncbi:AAA family ATPase [Jeotgalibaca sp. MA1X17-3]|uniref:McrB family protein n=1 Tax=Jeotgalibaca sp. MA1X17-3 TaxID=2908211 RepID=UPI001F3F92FE|nr:AAA family ATPase [Jeotgalibaca sp. MA1X17-3]UJF16668.1 AAA family ATPase [Jeotgalibaca sp. MA1X17-3]